MDTLDPVNDLGDPHVDYHAGQGKSMPAIQAELLAHEAEHLVDRQEGRLVQVFVNPQSDP